MVSMLIFFRDQSSFKNLFDVLVFVEHDTAELGVRQASGDSQVLKSAVRDAQHLSHLRTLQPLLR